MALFAPPDVASLAAKGDVTRLVRALSVPSVRRDAAIALGRLGDPVAVPPLLVALRDPDPAVRHASAWSLGLLHDAQSLEPLIGVLAYDEDAAVREAAAAALHALGSPAAAALAVALDAPDPCVRQASADVLARMGDPRALDPLIAALRAGSTFSARDLGCAAARALGFLGDPRAVGALIDVLTTSDVADVRDACTDGLCRIGAPAVGPLIDALGDAQGLARFSVTRTLGRIADTRAVEPLLTQLGEHPEDVAEIAEALGLIGDPRAAAPLTAALRDSTYSGGRTGPALVTALGRLGVPSGTALIDALRSPGPHRTREFAGRELARALGAIGVPAVPVLVEAVGDPDPVVRCSAADALGRIGDDRAREPLRARHDDPDEFVRATAANALRRLGDSQGLDADAAALRDAAEPLLARLYYGDLGTAPYAGSERDALGELDALLGSSARAMDADLLRRVCGLPDVLELESLYVDGDEYEQGVDCARVRELAFAELRRRNPHAWADALAPEPRV